MPPPGMYGIGRPTSPPARPAASVGLGLRILIVEDEPALLRALRINLRARGYDVQPIYSTYGKGKITYTADDIDVLIAHIIPLDTWYVIPIEAIARSPSLRFYPGIPCKCARWETYREAWHLLQ